MQSFLTGITKKETSTENKYSHAAVWGLVPSYIKKDGSLQYPLAAMVANLAKPTPERPALMRRVDSACWPHYPIFSFSQIYLHV